MGRKYGRFLWVLWGFDYQSTAALLGKTINYKHSQVGWWVGLAYTQTLELEGVARRASS